jgi:protein-disulfide isomerase
MNRDNTHKPSRADFMSGVRSGVNGTPTFFINGVRHDAASDFETPLESIEFAIDTD